LPVVTSTAYRTPWVSPTNADEPSTLTPLTLAAPSAEAPELLLCRGVDRDELRGLLVRPAVEIHDEVLPPRSRPPAP
jgi:hypothetical protein